MSNCKSYELLVDLLDKRWSMRVSIEEDSLRGIYYILTEIFFSQNPEYTEIDCTGATSEKKYGNYTSKVNSWCRSKAKELGHSKDRLLLIRDELKIYAKGKSICWISDKERFLVDYIDRGKVTQECSFILVCEKDTISKRLLSELSSRGYQMRFVSTEGHLSLDVQEVLVMIREEIGDRPNFYVLVLHDYDADGVGIYFEVKKKFPFAIDIGINRELLNYLKKNHVDPWSYEQPVNVCKNLKELKKIVEAGDPNYDYSDFEYLQGVHVKGKEHKAKRIEIDPLHNKYGTKVFADFIEATILERCTVWDLSRIGVEEFGLEEPASLYEKAMANYESKAWEHYKKKQEKIEVPIKNASAVVKEVCESVKQPFESLKKKYWQQGYVFHELKGASYDELKTDYKNQIEKKWAEENRFQLSLEEINSQIEYYEGDVRKGEDDLTSQIRDLGTDVREKQSEDEDLEPFKKRLKEIDWGEEELDALETPDEAELIHQVIDALQERLKELVETK